MPPPTNVQYANVAATKAGRGLIQEAQSYCLQMGMVNNETIFVPFSGSGLQSGEGSGASNFVLSTPAEEKMNAVLRVAGGRTKGSGGGVSCVLGSGCSAQLNLKSIPPWKMLD